jgi:hypothetical protein
MDCARELRSMSGRASRAGFVLAGVLARSVKRAASCSGGLVRQVADYTTENPIDKSLSFPD